jgi:ABC-type sugar transport system permease subunit
MQRTAAQPKQEKARTARRPYSGLAREEARLGLLLLLPAVLIIMAIAMYPLISAIKDSFFQINLRFENSPRPLVWLANYQQIILNDMRFRNALRVTGTLAAVSVIGELIIGMIVALVVNRPFFGRGLVRAAVLVPWALTTVVSAKMWSWIYDIQWGVLNDLLLRVHLIDRPIIWLANPTLTLWAMIGAEIWKTTPFMALLLLAGLQLIPGELYEAASIDGATAWQKFWRVTLPLMKPTILVALLFRTIDALRVFDLARVLTNGGPGQATETLSLYSYTVLFTNLNFGYGSALAVTTFLVVLIVSIFYVKVLGAPTQRGVG